VPHLDIADLEFNTGQPKASVVAPGISNTDVPPQEDDSKPIAAQPEKEDVSMSKEEDDSKPIAAQPEKEDVSMSKDVVQASVVPGTGGNEEVAEDVNMAEVEEEVEEEEKKEEEKPKAMTSAELAAIAAKQYPYTNDKLVEIIKNALDEERTGRVYYLPLGQGVELESGTKLFEHGVLRCKNNTVVGPGATIGHGSGIYIIIGALFSCNSHHTVLSVLEDDFFSEDLDKFEVSGRMERQIMHHGDVIPKGDVVVSSLASHEGFLGRAAEWCKLWRESQVIGPSSPVVTTAKYALRSKEASVKKEEKPNQKRGDLSPPRNNKNEQKLKAENKRLKISLGNELQHCKEIEQARDAAETRLEEANNLNRQTCFPVMPDGKSNNHPLTSPAPSRMVSVDQARLVTLLATASAENDRLQSELSKHKTNELLDQFLPRK
jgi:hypothetical protein